MNMYNILSSINFSSCLKGVRAALISGLALSALASPPYQLGFAAMTEEAFDDFDSAFHAENRVEDNELSKMRGGFLVNGLQIDFALTTQTIIDGVLRKEVKVESNQPNSIPEGGLHTLVQVGTNNKAIPLEQFAGVPAIINVVQNSKDNTVIQNLTLLDMEVSNLTLLRTRALVPQINYQSALASAH